MLRNLFGHLVTFERVLKSSDLKTKVICDTYQHQDLIGTVAVGMDETFAFEDFNQWLELQIAPRRNQVFFAPSHSRPVVIPVLLVITSTRESVTNHFFNAHA